MTDCRASIVSVSPETAILPARNERDLRDVPDEVRQSLQWRFVDHMDQVLETALVEYAMVSAGSPRAERRDTGEGIAARPG